jgi:L-alanine-DL-glutamate epimerase-like enolase superfamily enzyme
VTDDGSNLDPHKVWDCMFTNEKPGGHGERSVAIGTIDMAIWDAVAKIERKPLFQLLAERYGNGRRPQGVRIRRRLLLPGQTTAAERRDAQLHRPRLHRGQEKIGGARWTKTCAASTRS